MGAEPPQLSRFDGPLDLLLELINRRALDITTISLAAVAEQYLAEVAAMGETDLERLAGYLVIASKLLLIKSQALLPRSAATAVNEEEDATELLRQLEEYRRFKELALLLRQIEESQRRSFPRQVPFPVAARPSPGVGSPADLVAALRRALASAPEKPEVQVLSVTHFPIATKLREIRAALECHGRLAFSTLVARATCRPEVVAYFLALLELLRRGVVSVRQETLFGEILLTKPEAAPRCDERQAAGGADGVDADVDEAWLASGDEVLVQFVACPVEESPEPGQ